MKCKQSHIKTLDQSVDLMGTDSVWLNQYVYILSFCKLYIQTFTGGKCWLENVHTRPLYILCFIYFAFAVC